MKIKALFLSALVALASCGGGSTENTDSTTEKLSGTIKIDGSSTVYPITAGVAEYFAEDFGDVEVLVGVSGTGGGFKKFAVGETDISDASRPIKDKEATICAENNIKYQKLTVAYDGLAVVVNQQNTWVDHLTVEELKKIWINADDNAKTWADVRAGWPAEPITLYGPGTASGTFDYFNEAIIGEDGASRTDYNSSENDNVLVKGIADDKNALGYFGLAYYEENKDKLKIVPVDGGTGAIAPSMETVMNKSYAPLSRPIFIYVSDVAAKRPEVKKFVEFYQEKAAEISKMVGYIPLTEAESAAEKEAFKAFISK